MTRYVVKEVRDTWMGKCWVVWDTVEEQETSGHFAHSLRDAAERSADVLNAADQINERASR